MDCAKNGNSIDDHSASSPEQARENEIVVEASSSQERFYECTFCKRGFTNAQALGCHMNIHRRDRQRTGNNSKPVHSSFRSRPHSLASEPYSPLRETINCPSKYIENSFFDVQSSSPLGMNYDFIDPSLSLRIGNGHEEVAEVIKSDGGHEEDDIDLELRLGYFHG